jgi:hypothetical protein
LIPSKRSRHAPKLDCFVQYSLEATLTVCCARLKGMRNPLWVEAYEANSVMTREKRLFLTAQVGLRKAFNNQYFLYVHIVFIIIQILYHTDD